MLRNNLMLPTEALDIPEAIDFDGTNDYLSRSSDLTGNADGKTFTFSAWIDSRDVLSTFLTIFNNSDGTNSGLWVYFSPAGNNITFKAYNSSGGAILDATATFNCGSTFINVQASFDLVSTSNRSVYINDTAASVTYATYSNANIDFTKSWHGVGGAGGGGYYKWYGRLSHVFLDYTYRDLSIEANRRLFITADRKPAANQSALNPILYLPLNDPTQPGKNPGTGGDFNLTGVVARSGRGPSQFNAPYSDLNGSTQNVVRTSALVGASDGKQFTFACTFNTDNVANVRHVFDISNSTSANRLTIEHDNTESIVVTAANSAGTNILWLGTPANSTAQYRNFVVVVSFDLTDTGKRHISINGVNQTLSVYTYTDDTIDFVPATPRYSIGLDYVGGGYWDGRLGNVFFDTKYIDLSQPANLAKFVTGTGIDAKPADLGANGELPFGTAPLIYLPMYGNNAKKNYGIGGDFMVNSGPYPGARGPNEFWGNKADFDGTTGYLARTSSLNGVSDGKTVSGAFFFSLVSPGSQRVILKCVNANPNARVEVYLDSLNKLNINLYSSVNSGVVSWKSSNAYGSGDKFVTFCFDVTTTAKRFVYVNNTPDVGTYSFYENTSISFSDITGSYIGRSNTVAQYFYGKLSEFYFTTDYIDFSQEANRLKFRDAFGNPVDLTPQIEAGTLPTPAIYMRFDPANFGKNSGTSGDFMVSGTITDGGQL